MFYSGHCGQQLIPQRKSERQHPTLLSVVSPKGPGSWDVEPSAPTRPWWGDSRSPALLAYLAQRQRELVCQRKPSEGQCSRMVRAEGVRTGTHGVPQPYASQPRLLFHRTDMTTTCSVSADGMNYWLQWDRGSSDKALIKWHCSTWFYCPWSGSICFFLD